MNGDGPDAILQVHGDGTHPARYGVSPRPVGGGHDKNKSRSIIVAKGRRYWVYAYLFAKKDRANIDEDALRAFRKLADLYARKTDMEIEKELKTKDLVEICNDRDR